MRLTPKQCRMARAALGISVRELAEIATIRAATISHFESGGDSYRSTVDKLQGALEARGIVFIGKGDSSLSGGEGIRYREG